MLDPEDYCECCDTCKHCVRLSMQDRELFLRLMDKSYGPWREKRDDVRRVVKHTLCCVGHCEKDVGLVDLSGPICDEYERWDYGR